MLKMSDFEKGKETHQLICPAQLARGASYSDTTFLLYFSSPFAFFFFLCISLSAHSGFISLSLLFLMVIFTKCLVKGPACPQVWIRFTQGLGLCLAVFALTEVRRVRDKKGNFSKKIPSLAVRGYLRWRDWGIPCRIDLSFFYLFAKSVSLPEGKAVR